MSNCVTTAEKVGITVDREKFEELYTNYKGLQKRILRLTETCLDINSIIRLLDCLKSELQDDTFETLVDAVTMQSGFCKHFGIIAHGMEKNFYGYIWIEKIDAITPYKIKIDGLIHVGEQE